MPAEYPPTITQPTNSSAFAATIPELTDNADIVATLSDYHDNISWYLSDRVSKSLATSQTVTGPVIFSGSSITLSGASITISGSALSISSTMSVSGATTFTGSLTAQNGLIGDIFAPGGSIRVLDNGTGATLSLSGTSITGYDAVFSGTAAAARSSILYSNSTTSGNYTTITGVRRLFVGAIQPDANTAPQAGDIWMW